MSGTVPVGNDRAVVDEISMPSRSGRPSRTPPSWYARRNWLPCSTMRVKRDENLPAELVEDLRALGHDVDSVLSEGWRACSTRWWPVWPVALVACC